MQPLTFLRALVVLAMAAALFLWPQPEAIGGATAPPGGFEAEPVFQACAASTDEIVHAESLPPVAKVIQKAWTKWGKWIDSHEGDYCMTLIFSPGLGSDGKPILAPVLLVFLRSTTSDWFQIQQQKGPVA